MADWSQELRRNTPTYDDLVGFIADYEAARSQPFTPNERRAARAWAAYFIAYQAWITIRPGEPPAPDSWAAALEAAGERLLR